MRILMLLGIVIIAGCAASAQPAPTNTATLSWTAPTTNTDGSTITAGAVTYNIYQTPAGAVSGGVKLASALADTGDVVSTQAGGGPIADGQTLCYNVTAVVAGVESAYSNQACKTWAAGTPVAPSGLTVK